MERLLHILLLGAASGCHMVTGATDFETHDFVGEWDGLCKVFVALQTHDLNAHMNVESEDGLLEIRAASSTFQLDVDYEVKWEESREREYAIELLCTPSGACTALHDQVCMELFNRPCGPDDPRLPPPELQGRCVTSEDADDLECEFNTQFLCAFTRDR